MSAPTRTAAVALGVLVAATAGWIGYMGQQSLERALARARVARPVVTIITQVEVDETDPRRHLATKFIGRELSVERASDLEAAGEAVRVDGGGRSRRMVASPLPAAIHELPPVRQIVDSGAVVICAGVGGVPVYCDVVTGWEGVDAVFDKGLAASALASELGAGLRLPLTYVHAVHTDWGRPIAQPIWRKDVATARELDMQGTFGEGSMAPKVRAAINFVRRTNGRAIITELGRGREAVRGKAGTTITAESA